MAAPEGFSWIDRPRLAASARPESADELRWLRQVGLELVITLTEEPLRRDWVGEASLLALHVPIQDMEAPTQDQIEAFVSAVHRAHAHEMGVHVHCAAGLGRSGTMLACHYVAAGMTAREAIQFIREIRPGSIETEEQVEAVEMFARQFRSQN